MFLIRAVMLAEIEKSNSVCGRVLIGIVVVCARGLGCAVSSSILLYPCT